MVLLDTNVCIDFARGRSRRLYERLDAAFDAGIAISTVTLAELRVGARASGGRDDADALAALTASIDVLPFDEAAAEDYGALVRQVGVKRRSFDRLIAAHARSRGLALVTSNEADFADVPGLVVENWTR